MADKSQNIFINYKFNTAEIDKAQSAVNRANAATNTLQQSAGTAGNKINQSFRQATPSIERMNIELARLKTQISVATDPKKIAELSNQFKVLKTNIDAATKSAFALPKALNDTKTAGQSLTQQFGGLFAAARAFVTAGIAKEALDITLAMASLSGNVAGVERAFNRAFPNNIRLMDALRKATQGTVTDFELMQRTLQAKNLGVAIEPLPRLFEFAAARAQQTGESVDYLVDSIVRGIGRKSPLILDNLGISALRLKEELGGVSAQAASVVQVTEAVGRIAEQELKKMGGIAVTTATQVGKLKASFEELKISVSENVTSSGLLQFFQDAITGAQLLVDAQKRSGIETARSIALETAAAIKESKAFKELGTDKQKQFDFIQQEMNSRVQLIGRYNDNIAKLKEERDILKDKNPYDERVEQLRKTIVGYENNKVVLASTILVLKEYRNEIKLLNDDPAPSTGIIERAKAEIERIQELIEKTNDASNLSSIDGGVVKVGELIQQLSIAQAELADLQREFSDIDIKPLEIQVKDVTKAILELDDAANNSNGLGALFDDKQVSIVDRNVQSIEESLKRLADANPFTKPGDTVAIQDTFWSELGREFEENWRDILSNGIDLQAGFINDVLEADLDNMKRQMTVLRNYYDEQQILAGDNKRAKDALRLQEERDTTALQKRIFEKEKKTRRAQAIVDGAAAIVKTFALYGFTPAGIIAAAGQAAVTIAQLAVISKATPGFKDGVIDLKGKGTGTSDSIPANLSRGESVMTAWETRHAGDVLRDIRAKKLDNKMLKSLKQGREPVHVQQPFDDSRMIKAIEKNRAPDVIAQSGLVYEVTKRTEIYHRKIRAKSVKL